MGARPWKTYSTSVLGTFKHEKSAFVEVKRNVLKYTSLDYQKRVEKNSGLRHHEHSRKPSKPSKLKARQLAPGQWSIRGILPRTDESQRPFLFSVRKSQEGPKRWRGLRDRTRPRDNSVSTKIQRKIFSFLVSVEAIQLSCCSSNADDICKQMGMAIFQ